MKNKPVKFENKPWAAGIPLKYAIQFYRCNGEDVFFDSDFWLGRSAVHKFTYILPKHTGSNYFTITGNFLTCPPLLRSLRKKGERDC